MTAMAVDVSIEGAANLPETPHLILVNRLHLPTLRALETSLGGEEKVAWLIENTLRPSGEIIDYVARRRGGGILFSLTQQEKETLHTRIRKKLAAGCHIVLLVGQPDRAFSCVSDVPPGLLNFLLDAVQEEVVPVYEGLYSTRNGAWEELRTAPPYTRAVLRILPAVRAGIADARSITMAWQLAAAEQVETLAQRNTEDSLSEALLQSLLSHPRAAIIDGINEQRMSYLRLLSLAAPLARSLRQHISTPRLGIILPPGRLSIIANVACILAGMVPINIDYTYPASVFRRMADQTQLTRFLSGHSFAQKLEGFAWPPARDMLYIDETLPTVAPALRGVQDMLVALLGKRRIMNWIHSTEQDPEQEALAIYNCYSDGTGLHGVSMSHRAVLTGYRLTHSRLENKERVLSCLPFHHRAGLLLGLLYPLLAGSDIITYPDPKAGKRIRELIRHYTPSSATIAPEQVPHILPTHPEKGQTPLRQLFVAGHFSSDDARQAYSDHKVYLCECYMPLHCTMPAACSLPPAAHTAELPSALRIRWGSPGTAGQPLIGLAIRIGSLESSDPAPQDKSPGLIYVKGTACSARSAAEQSPPGSSPLQWICTGDIGYLQEDGQLVVCGPREDFSVIGGELISHRETERLLTTLLRLPGKEGEPPKIVVVSTRPKDGRGDDVLVLLSTLHKTVGPHDVITLRYTLINARYSKNMAPQHIIPLRAIPTLPDGAVNYPLCRILAAKALAH